VGGADDGHSLALGDGGSATTPPVCIDVEHPTIRLFARNAGSSWGDLHVSVRVRGLLGLWLTLPIGTVSAGAEWAPTHSLPVIANLLSLIRDGQAVYFRFEAAGGDWSIDDLYVDPYTKG
jgi:hypothetical protein